MITSPSVKDGFKKIELDQISEDQQISECSEESEDYPKKLDQNGKYIIWYFRQKRPEVSDLLVDSAYEF